MEAGHGNQRSASGSRRTRSQAAPEWTVNDVLILVHVVAAVEADCSKALSSFQKWKIISKNCHALGVPRSLNQCRRKWDSLMAEYNQIKSWESQSKGGSYWSLNSEQRRKFMLPENFDSELFKAIDVVVTTQEDEDSAEPDGDPGAQQDEEELEPNNYSDAESQEQGPKKSRRRTVTSAEGKHQKSSKGETPLIDCRKEGSQELHREKKPGENLAEEKPQDYSAKKDDLTGFEEEQLSIAAKLRECAEETDSIVKENLSNCMTDDQRHDEGAHMELVRRQGDRLIACLGNILETLGQFREFE